MRISLPQRKKSLLSLTSLIDVIFLLLLFFMLTSVFMRFSTIEMAQTAKAADGPGAPGILIRLEGAGALRVNGAETDIDDLPALLENLAQKGADSAVVQTSESATTQDLVDLTERLKASPILNVTLQR